MEDVTLGHERRPIPIDMSEVDGGPNGKREREREREISNIQMLSENIKSTLQKGMFYA
jgi:hypothetical protein